MTLDGVGKDTMKNAWNRVLALFGSHTAEDYTARLNKLDQQLWELVQPQAASLSRMQLHGYVWARARGASLGDTDSATSQLVADLTLRFVNRIASNRQQAVRRAA